MRGAARLGRLQLALIGLALAAVGTGVAAMLGSASLDAGSLQAVAAACQQVLPASSSIAGLLGLLFVALAVAVVVQGTRSLLRQLRDTSRHLETLPTTGETVIVRSTRCIVIAGERPVAFCAGLLRPRVHLSRGALAQLSEPELEAVVAHELHHVGGRDPLRLLLLRSLADALFFLPVLKEMTARYVALRELAADEAAVEALGERRSIAAALLRFTERESPRLAVAGIAAERVDHLRGDPLATRWRLPRRAAAASAASAALLVVALVHLTSVESPTTTSLPLLLAQSCMPLMGLAALAAILAPMVRLRQRPAT